MSNLVLTAAKTLGPTLLKTAGNIAIQSAQGLISSAFAPTREGPRLSSLQIQSSQDGAPMPRLFGRGRLAGQIIWASALKETESTERSGGKGSPKTRGYRYSISVAIGLCEGEISGVGRIWANGEAFDKSRQIMRVHNGAEDQDIDPLIAMIDGDDSPHFRGTAYVVFEDLPLEDFGNRLPQFNFEVFRKMTASEERLEDLVKGVDLIPASGEFSYAQTPVERRTGPGASQSVNLNNLSGDSDFSAAINQLEDHLPNCDHVMLVVSWFGTDLRCGKCEILPGVEGYDTVTQPLKWAVSGVQRNEAYRVSATDGRPNYGGTPSDNSILEAIAALKARDIKISIYPFVLMDITSGNNLVDPYGRSAQPAFPWRGRISCDPAPGQAQSVDKTAAATQQVNAFFGTAQPADFQAYDQGVTYNGKDEFRFRRMILHYAHLAKKAGGVDGFVIGSEMRGLTTIRSQSGYPAVDKFVTLAADVRSVLGPETRLTYAADWSEYFGHHPHDGSGDVTFHLDPLWSSSAIDAIGIDAYFPLSDWRENDGHLDAQISPSIYDLDYLKSQMEGGEGYDYFYASSADRDAQIRTPITDGAGKPWVFRYKDIRNWWGQPHVNRIGGVEQAGPTAWQPKSKPIWLTEIGCPAVDKGANQPNVFYDPKSAESFLPYHSNGERDDLIQRRYLEAFLSYWNDTENNPASPTGQSMIDTELTCVWCWDARPFPDFPARRDVWSDGENWRRGHWLSGRVGMAPLASVVNDIAAASGLTGFSVAGLTGLVSGYMLDRPMSGRAALEPLMQAYNFSVRETGAGTEFFMQGHGDVVTINADLTVIDNDAPSLQFIRDDAEARPRDVRLRFVDDVHDYLIGSASARGLRAETQSVSDIALPLVMDAQMASRISARLLEDMTAGLETVRWISGAHEAALQVGDRVRVQGHETIYVIERADGNRVRQIRARKEGPITGHIVAGGDSPKPQPLPYSSVPELQVVDCAAGLYLGVQAERFSGAELELPSGETMEFLSAITVGATLTALPARSSALWDEATTLDITWRGPPLQSQTHLQALAEPSPFAIQDMEGEWTLLTARNRVLIAPQTYRLSGLLHGLRGTETQGSIAAGAKIVRLGPEWTTLTPPEDAIGGQLTGILRGFGRRDSAIVSADYKGIALRPLSPVHPHVRRDGDDIDLRWIRRSREAATVWTATDIALGELQELYRVQIYNGASMIEEHITETPQISINAQSGPMTHADIAQISQLYGPGRARRVML